MDTNPFANNQAQAAAPTGQTAPSTTYASGIANMIKAIMQGNDQFKQQQGQGQGQMPLMSGSPVPGAAGPTSVGGPQGPAPITGADAPMAPAPAIAASPSDMTGGLGASPVAPDPVTQALMSPIPGQGNGMDGMFNAPNPLAVGGSWGG